jgi:hypothetical protein
MTRLPRRASLLLALSLLTSAATASAECAWVLWNEVTDIEGGQQISTLCLVSASQTVADCRTSQKTTMKGWENNKGLTKTSEDSVFQKLGELHMTICRLLCLPDTVDPRK